MTPISFLTKLLQSDIDPQLKMNIIAKIYEVNIPQIFLQLFFSPHELSIPYQIFVDPQEIIASITSILPSNNDNNNENMNNDNNNHNNESNSEENPRREREREGDEENEEEHHETIIKRRTTKEKIIKKIKQFITVLLYFDVPDFIEDFSSIFPHELLLTCLPKFQNQNIQNMPFRFGSSDYALVKILAKFYTHEFVELIIDEENLQDFIQIAKKHRKRQVKIDALDALGYLFQEKPPAIELCFQEGIYDLISITYTNCDEKEITPDGICYLIHIVDCCNSVEDSININLSPTCESIFTKNPLFFTKQKIFQLFSKYFSKADPEFLQKILSKNNFMTDYLDWFLNETNDVLQQVIPGFAFLITFAKDNQLTGFLTEIIDEDDLEKFNEIEESFSETDMAPFIEIIQEFFHSQFE